MVEAGIVLPVIILSVMLLLRLFTFYLEIMTTSVKEHLKVFNAWDSYNGAAMKKYEISNSVELVKGGVLLFDINKKIDSTAYFFNEDNLVRAGEVIGSE